jgi:hypothetical protein
MRLGDLAHLTERLKALGFSGTLNTAFVERISLTLRHAACGGVWRLCPVAPGPRHNSPANCSPISNGGEPITISAVPTCRCNSSWMGRKRGGESRPHAGMGRAHRRWRPVSLTVSGQWKSCWRSPWVSDLADGTAELATRRKNESQRQLSIQISARCPLIGHWKSQKAPSTSTENHPTSKMVVPNVEGRPTTSPGTAMAISYSSLRTVDR